MSAVNPHAPTLTKLLFVAFGGLIPGAFFGFRYQYGVRVEEKVRAPFSLYASSKLPLDSNSNVRAGRRTFGDGAGGGGGV